jgi:MATE family multidrug resistance protein
VSASLPTSLPILKSHLALLIKLALPVIGAQVGMMALGVVDTVMVGRFSVEALAAASIGNACFYTLLWIGVGFVQGIDPLVTQAHGAKHDHHAVLALKRGVIIAIGISVPILAGLLLTEKILLFFKQSPPLVLLAKNYIAAQLWSVPLFLLFMALRQYFQGREIVKPILWIVIAANGFNFLGNYVFIHGHFGAPPLGLTGAGIASGLTRALMFVALLAWAMGQTRVSFSWLPLQRAVYDLKQFLRIFQVGTPVAVQIGFEVMAFNGCVLIAGLLGQAALGAHSIALNLASLAFMIPLGISQAAVTRVGNLIGAQQLQEAKRAAWVGIFFGGTVMLGSASFFWTFQQQLPGLYTDNAEVILIAASVLPIVAAFQIFDGIQVVCAGVLRGMGRPLPSTLANLFAFWVIGLPVGYWTAIELGFRIKALWWSLVIGLSLVAVLLTLWIAYRGPETHARQFE